MEDETAELGYEENRRCGRMRDGLFKGFKMAYLFE